MQRTVDIILLSYENPGYLRRCTESILNNTGIVSRLIIVDNASRDKGVKIFLDSLKGSKQIEVIKVFNKKNLGFSSGINTGLEVSDARYCCILNNDTVVYKGWLGEMIRVAEKRTDIGIVNPQSNTFGSKPAEGKTYEEHARALLFKNALKFTETGHAIAFAALIKKEVIDKVGFFDESYQGVCYEDTDFSVRAQQAGYISVIAEGAYVYHKEQLSRSKLPRRRSIYAANLRRFEEKWGKLLRILYVNDTAFGGFKVLSGIYEELRKLARRRCIINCWLNASEGNIADFFKESNVIKHADIAIRAINNKNGISNFRLLWEIIKKKKKYDALILNGRRYSGLLLSIISLTGTKVFENTGGAGLKAFGGKKLSFVKNFSDIPGLLR